MILIYYVDTLIAAACKDRRCIDIGIYVYYDVII